MRTRTKMGIVAGGYLLAAGAGMGAGALYDARMAAMPYDTSGGMYAAGESMAAFAAFFVVALLPTAAALWFLRGNHRFWQAVAVASFAFAGLGLIAALATMAARGTPGHPAAIALELYGLAQLLGVPLWTAAMVVFACLAPTRTARRLLVAAIGIELVIGACAAFHWFLRGPGI